MHHIAELLEHLITLLLPVGVAMAELIGVCLVLITLINATVHCIEAEILGKTVVNKKGHKVNYRIELSSGLVTALAFKMAAEILKTIQVTNFQELLILAGVFGLRFLMTEHLNHETKEELESQRAEEIEDRLEEELKNSQESDGFAEVSSDERV